MDYKSIVRTSVLVPFIGCLVVLIQGCGSGDRHTETSVQCSISFNLFEELSDSNQSDFETIAFTENSVVIETDADFCQVISEDNHDNPVNTSTINTDVEAGASQTGEIESAV